MAYIFINSLSNHHTQYAFLHWLMASFHFGSSTFEFINNWIMFGQKRCIRPNKSLMQSQNTRSEQYEQNDTVSGGLVVFFFSNCWPFLFFETAIDMMLFRQSISTKLALCFTLFIHFTNAFLLTIYFEFNVSNGLSIAKKIIKWANRRIVSHKKFKIFDTNRIKIVLHSNHCYHTPVDVISTETLQNVEILSLNCLVKCFSCKIDKPYFRINLIRNIAIDFLTGFLINVSTCEFWSLASCKRWSSVLPYHTHSDGHLTARNLTAIVSEIQHLTEVNLWYKILTASWISDIRCFGYKFAPSECGMRSFNQIIWKSSTFSQCYWYRYGRTTMPYLWWTTKNNTRRSKPMPEQSMS